MLFQKSDWSCVLGVCGCFLGGNGWVLMGTIFHFQPIGTEKEKDRNAVVPEE